MKPCPWCGRNNLDSDEYSLVSAGHVTLRRRSGPAAPCAEPYAPGEVRER